ncbi:hypothetical protein BJX70DRAFT_402171 [Aspergillus crustosus]
MTFAYDHEAEFWGVLINPDKSPSQLLEQLCLGIAQVATTFDNLPIADLTPERLAAFYRKVGGNYDVLFLDTRPSALSFIYQRLGCFHSIQPSTDPYKPPSIPALQPHGFVRWQTIQLLLDPDEHVAYLQNALERWNIFNPSNGTLFPKTIPREAFPAEPDPEMIQWHETVSQKFEFDYWKKNLLRSSPPTSNVYQNQFNTQKESPTTPKAEESSQNQQPRASGYRYPTPADSQSSRRHQRRQSAEVPQSTLHKPQTSVPRRSAEFASGYASPRAPSPPTYANHAQPKGRGRERKTYSRPVSPEPLHEHSSSDASSEDSGTATQEPSSPPPQYDDHGRNLSPPHAPNARRHSHEAYSRRPHRELSPDSQRRYAYRDAFNATSTSTSNSNSNRVYDSDSGRGIRQQPRVYIDEVRQSRTPVNNYREPVFGESATVPTSPVYGHAHPIHPVHAVHPVHPRFMNMNANNQGYMVHPQSELDANIMEDPRRSSYRGSLTPNPNPNPSSGSNYGRPRFASVSEYQAPRWSGVHGHGHAHSHGHGPVPGPGGRGVPPGIIEAEYASRRTSMFDWLRFAIAGAGAIYLDMLTMAWHGMAPISSSSFSPFSSLNINNIRHLLPRQSTTSDNDSSSCSCPSSISGGGIAGIVIGSIAGTLLLIWLWRTCMMQSAIHDAEKTGAPVMVSNGYPTNEATTHYRRRRRRGSPVYSEKVYSGRSGRSAGGGSVRRPKRVYVS